jgi:prephenate dehydratase
MQTERAKLGYFGKPGSFSHLIASRIAKSGEELVSCESVTDVFVHVGLGKSNLGIVPVENSSAGMIESTINHLVMESAPPTVLAEYALNVKLAFLSKSYVDPILKIYSHFAPLQHCESWLKRTYPNATLIPVESTSAAAALAEKEPGTAAISQFSAAERYGLQVLHFPIDEQAQNLTQFFLLGHASDSRPEPPTETSLAVALKNVTGSLCRFLSAFAELKINLKRIKSQNVYGRPNTYIFFIGIEAAAESQAMRQALSAAQEHAEKLKILGSYPVYAPFES